MYPGEKPGEPWGPINNHMLNHGKETEGVGARRPRVDQQEIFLHFGIRTNEQSHVDYNHELSSYFFFFFHRRFAGKKPVHA